VRVLALDYGSARCGCALSDPTGTIVTPIEPIPRPSDRRGLAALATLVTEREVEHVLVGLPLSLRGQTRAFAAALSARLGTDVSVELYDERFTTRIAASIEHAATSEDSRAAAVLLEEWLARAR
jgi:putative Holliday junction resolvase